MHGAALAGVGVVWVVDVGCWWSGKARGWEDDVVDAGGGGIGWRGRV